jgi:prolipoprotein diacylglyceryltransferase
MMTGYTIRLGCGVIVGLIWLWISAPKFHFDHKTLGKWCWILSALALVTGRIAYGFIHGDYFLQNPLQLMQLHRIGGIHGESALVGGLVGLGILVINSQKRNVIGATAPLTNDAQSLAHALPHAFALFVPAVLCVAAGAWWGCMQAGCAWGREVTTPDALTRWLLIDGPDLYHIIRPRYPVQLAGTLWSIGLAVFGAVSLHHATHGTLILILYCLGAAILTLLRGDNVPAIGFLRVDTVENLGIAFIVSGLQLWYIPQSKVAA